MKTAPKTSAARFAIVSESFFPLTEPESALLESYARGYMDLQRNLGEAPPLKRWEIIYGKASEGDIDALEILEKFGTSDAYISWDTARIRGLWTVFGRQCVERWPEVVTLAQRARKAAEELLKEYRSTTCSFREKLELEPRPSSDAVTETLQEVIESCVYAESGPHMTSQLTEPPRPTFYGLTQIE